MPGVFVSHAYADEEFVTAFVEQILRLGCALPIERIFYSSGADTGIEPGKDVASSVRDKVGEADLVIAVISPTYQTRPYCIAELGAAWVRTDALLPVLTPGMAHTDLKGVLGSVKVGHLDDRTTLNALHDRVVEMTGVRPKATTWGQHLERWLERVSVHAETLKTPAVVDPDDFRAVKNQLAASEADRQRLQEAFDKLLEAKTLEEAREAALPEEESAHFHALLDTVRDTLRKFSGVLEDAIWFDAKNQQMLWPQYLDDPDRHGDALRAVDDGYLYDDDEFLRLNKDFPDVWRACAAVRELADFMNETSPEFIAWFKDEYDLPPNLEHKRVWQALLH